MELYDIHGFLIAVEGTANNIFMQEYGWAKVFSKQTEINLYVRPYNGKENLPTEPAGSLKGMRIPFGEGEDTLFYQDGVALNVLLAYCEALLWWPDKTLLHAGGVARNGRAYIFIGGGNVGKTSIVLNLLKEGYEYLSDDWIVVGEGKAYPLPKLIRIFDYNLKSKEIARSVLGPKRLFYRPFFKLLEIGREHAPNRYVRYALEVLKPTFRTDFRRLYPEARMASPSPVSKIFYLERRNVEDITVIGDVSPERIARRMAYVNLYEWHFFFREYYRYAFAQDVRNPKIENRFDHCYKIILDTLQKGQLCEVSIPIGLDLTKADLVSILGLD